MSNAALPLRPLTVGDLLDETIRLCRRNLLRFIAVTAVALIPSIVISMLSAAFSMAAASLLDPVSAAAISVVLNVVLWLVGVVTAGATIYVVSEAYLGQRLAILDAYGRAFRRMLSLFGLFLVYLLVVTILSVTIIGIPFATYLAIAWGFSFQALLLEGLGIREALGRSRALVRGHWWRVFGITSLFMLFVSVIAALFWMVLLIPVGVSAALFSESSAATGLAIAMVVLMVIGYLLMAVLIGPLWYVGWVLTYYDLRVRKEGFDLELQARELAPPAPRPVVG